MTTITLRPITPDNWVECMELTPTADQQARGYVAPNVLPLVQAYVERWWTPLAVYANETMVGLSFMVAGRPMVFLRHSEVTSPKRASTTFCA